MKKILCIDGGGMRGYLPAAILIELERRTGKPCCEMFDMIAGTSIGAIIAALLSTGVPAGEAIKFFTEDGKTIFKKHWWRAFGLLLPRYPATPIESVLKKRFGGRTTIDCKTNLLVTSLELKSQQPYFFKSYDPDELPDPSHLWKTARATSSAQTYFPAFYWPDQSGTRVFWDGGNVANNPSVCAYADAVKLWPENHSMIFLSLGCGASNVSLSPKKMINCGAIRAAEVTVEMLFEAGSEDVDYEMKQLIGGNYFRIQPQLSVPLALDDASVEGLEKLENAASDCLKQNSKILDDFLAAK